MSCGIVGNNIPKWNFPFKITCDGPERGGISGNIRTKDKPTWGMMEERPTMIDLRTGERVYVDQYIKENGPKIFYKA